MRSTKFTVGAGLLLLSCAAAGQTLTGATIVKVQFGGVNLQGIAEQAVREVTGSILKGGLPSAQPPPPAQQPPVSAPVPPKPTPKGPAKLASQPSTGATAKRASQPQKVAGATSGAAVAGGAPAAALQPVATPPRIALLRVPLFRGVPYRGGGDAVAVEGGPFQLMRWFTAMQLAAQPELLDDPDIALYVARMFLPAEKWVDYLDCDPSCTKPPQVSTATSARGVPNAKWKGNDEFSRPRSHAAFVADYRHAFETLAARYPLELYIAFSGYFGTYSPALGGFPVQWHGTPDDKSNTFWTMPLAGHYAAPMVATLPAVLPCQPERCEQLIAQTQNRRIYGLTKLRITKLEADSLGVSRGKALQLYLSEASPDGDLGVYADKNFSALLHRFDGLATIAAGQALDEKVAASAFTSGPALFNPDTMLLLRAKYDPTWRTSARFSESRVTAYKHRRESEALLYGLARSADGRWPVFDRWGPYFQGVNANRNAPVVESDVTKFSRWTDARVRALPPSLLIRHWLYENAPQKSPIELVGTALDLGGSHAEGLGRGYAQVDLAGTLSAQGVAPAANLLSIDFPRPYDLQAAVLVFPQSLKRYVVERKPGVNVPTDGGMPVSEFEVDIDAVKLWPEEAPNTLLVYVTPREARVLKGSAVIAQSAIRSDAASLAAPFGHDILGITLGMPFRDAEAQVRAQIEPDSVEHWEAQTPGLGYSTGKIYSSYQKRDFVGLVATMDGKVAAVTRTVALGRDADVKAIVAQIVEKYGEPQKKVESHYQYEWHAHPMADLCYTKASQRTDVMTIEGPSKGSGKVSNSHLTLFAPDGPYADVQAFDQCGPLLAMRASYGGNGALLHFTMYDHRAYVQTAKGLKQPAVDPSAPAAPKLKF